MNNNQRPDIYCRDSCNKPGDFTVGNVDILDSNLAMSANDQLRQFTNLTPESGTGGYDSIGVHERYIPAMIEKTVMETHANTACDTKASYTGSGDDVEVYTLEGNLKSGTVNTGTTCDTYDKGYYDCGYAVGKHNKCGNKLAFGDEDDCTCGPPFTATIQLDEEEARLTKDPSKLVEMKINAAIEAEINKVISQALTEVFSESLKNTIHV